MSVSRDAAAARPPTPRPPAGAPFRVVGAPSTRVRDSYHDFLRASWPSAISRLVAVYLILNAIFALAYVALGGIANARPGVFRDAFYFSVQTMGTIGYGAMYPTTDATNLLVVVESVTGLLVTALATGLVFAKFGRITARVMFTRQAVISPYDDVPTLMIRVGNERTNQIVDAQFRAVFVRTERSREGVRFYRFYDLKLSRERTTALSRSFTVMHVITPDSPLYGYTPERMAADEVELTVAVAGTDDITMQPVHATANYGDDEVLWGVRHSDVLSEDADGTIVLDLSKFHDTEPTKPTGAFPYPRAVTDSQR